jgi:hypothetical protein
MTLLDGSAAANTSPQRMLSPFNRRGARFLTETISDICAGGVGKRVRHGWGETTDQLRTTTAELSALQRSTMDTSE